MHSLRRQLGRLQRSRQLGGVEGLEGNQHAESYSGGMACGTEQRCFEGLARVVLRGLCGTQRRCFLLHVLHLQHEAGS